MTNVVIINKGGTVKTETIKSINVSELHKKCKFRKSDDFEKRHTWKYDNKWVSVYAKDKGRANSENKYDLPPPIDNELYFGSLIVIMHKNETPVNNEVCDLTKEIWLKVYEKLFGGFEDLGDEDTESEEEDIPDHMKTKEGYLKDGFVVSDDIEEEEDSDFECPSEEESADEEETENDEDDEANYGGETDDEENVDDDDDDDDEDDDSDDDPASELSEEEYSY
jgi:hypothetical protein